jgi:hypothetical protein
LDDHNRVHIIECKGNQKSSRETEKQFTMGREQGRVADQLDMVLEWPITSTISRVMNEVADATGATRGLPSAAWFHVAVAFLSDNHIQHRAQTANSWT